VTSLIPAAVYSHVLTIACLVLFALPASETSAHTGRRFTVEVVNGKLQAQGVNTGAADGAPSVRPYLNVIHDHWKNDPSLDQAYATLPGYDVPPTAATPLIGHSLSLEFLGVSRWQSPPMAPSASTVPVLTPLALGHVVTVEGAVGVASSIDFGTVTLLENTLFGGAKDLDPLYQVNYRPANEISVLKFILRSSSPTVQSSDPIFVLLSPDGATPMEKLHHASLFLENHLATVPEPTTAALSLVIIGSALITCRPSKAV
jgi:hypothetical protein